MDPRHTPKLHPDELRRYARQLVLDGWGEPAQRRLSGTSVLLVGLGGLGSPVALYLAAAGVGRLVLVEPDCVERSNLHRQILFGEADVGTAKTDASARRLRDLNPHVAIELVPAALHAANARSLVRSVDLVVDGTDNFAARYAVNDACVLEGRPNVHGAVQGFEGQVTVLAHPDGPCYRCLFPEPPPAGAVPSCAEAGVLGVLPGTIGLFQATEVLKLAVGIGEPLVGRMLRFDALRGSTREVRLRRDPRCPICGDRPVIDEVVDETAGCGDPLAPVAEDPGSKADDPGPAPRSNDGTMAEVDAQLSPEISVEELARRRGQPTAPVVLDVRLPQEIEFASLGDDVLHIPVHLLPRRLAELDPRQEYAVLCHYGERSWQAVQFLRARGFSRSRNVEGGIDRWSVLIDRDVPRY